MRILVVFDVDGTLTQSMGVDTELFVEAAKAVLGLDAIDTDWATYTHVTDTGVLHELALRHAGRAASAADVAAVRDRFVGMLRAELAERPHRCTPVPGADRMLRALEAHADVGCAVATGGWRASALLKTDAAGLAVRHLPMATSDDAHERTVIMRTAIERARPSRAAAEGADIVYVGDAVWDVKASAEMGLRFVGVGDGVQAERLREAGARHVVADFRDLDVFLAHLGV